jgi:GH43 family beta-xylosidase
LLSIHFQTRTRRLIVITVLWHNLPVGKRCNAILCLGLLCVGAAAQNQPSASTFTNPILDSGPDPAVIYRGGYYYYMNSTGVNLTIWKSRDITDLRHAEKKVVWVPPSSGADSHELWAPELHFLQGKWYIYFAADYGDNKTHRLFVIENSSTDPLDGQWTMKGQVKDATNKWAIDPSVFENRGTLYIIWSGWEGDQNGTQNIYLARLKNPWTIEGPRVRLSTPEFPWEEVGDLPRGDPPHVNVNEGPEILQHKDKIFLIYSGGGCWTDDYSLGMLEASAESDLMNPASWKKTPAPVFAASPAAHVYGTGHNTFFKSPDGNEDWIIYHANPESGEGCGRYRSPRAQRFTWNEDGTPNFGTPLPLNTVLEKPSGQHP